MTAFYAMGVFIGRRRGKTGLGTYRTPWFPLFPGLGVLIIYVCVYLLAYAYYRFVLMRRPERWTMVGPEEIDAAVAG